MRYVASGRSDKILADMEACNPFIRTQELTGCGKCRDDHGDRVD